MKVVVIGGTGLIGSKLVNNLRQKGHEVLAASPNSGVNTITGEGLAEALAGANVVVDVANSPSFEDKAVMEFFETSGRNLLAAEIAAGVKHHIALSIVGTERLPESGYMRAKVAQEKLIKESGVPYSIVHSTQFFEFLNGIAEAATDGETVRLSPAYFQPISADDVVNAMADIATGEPINGMIEIAGPAKFRIAELIQQYMNAKQDTRKIIVDGHARYFGTELNDESLVPGENARLGTTTFDAWLGSQKLETQSSAPKKTVVLVHGSFADGSSWEKIIPTLQAEGLDVVAVQNPLTSLADDAAAATRAIDSALGEVILVGHSWGGAVITEAGNNEKVAALVYVAAFAPSKGESVNDVLKGYPEPQWYGSVKVDSGGFLSLLPEAVSTFFAQDLSAEQTGIIAATQGPILPGAFGDKITEAAWSSKPSWYIVAANDRMIGAEPEKDMAKKIGATTTVLQSSHVPMISQPNEVANVILAAAGIMKKQNSAVANAN